MYSAAFIIPYFGKFDNIFNLWLNSCKLNDSIDFIIITDSNEEYDFPQNVKVVKTSFNKLKVKIQKLYDFKISLEHPYRLCNFRPAYGEIFEDLIKGYDYWGFCDVDLIFGNLRNFFPKDNSYDKIGTFGHLTLIKNTYKNNRLYRYKDAYKVAFSENMPLFFDENTFNKICDKHKFKVFDLKIADLYPRYKNHYIVSDKRNCITKRNIFLWNEANGLTAIYRTKNGLKFDEYAYVHFLKRPMLNKVTDLSAFYIVPNRIINSEESASMLFDKYCTNGFFVAYWKNSFKWNNFKERILNRLYKNKIINNRINSMNERL